MAIAHIRNGAIITRFAGEKGWFHLEDGRQVSPPSVGFVDGNDKIVPIVEETVDNSTGPDRKSTVAAPVVEASRVLIRTTIEDMTPQEIDDNKTAQASVQDVLLKVITNHENRLRTLEGRPSVTEGQVKNFLKGLL